MDTSILRQARRHSPSDRDAYYWRLNGGGVYLDRFMDASTGKRYMWLTYPRLGNRKALGMRLTPANRANVKATVRDAFGLYPAVADLQDA